MPNRQSNWGHLAVTDTLPRKTPEGRKVWVNFIPNIDLGHILTMIGFAAATVTIWNVQDRRITVVEQKQEATQQQIQDMRADLKEIKTTLNQVQQAIAVQSYITSNTPRK